MLFSHFFLFWCFPPSLSDRFLASLSVFFVCFPSFMFVVLLPPSCYPPLSDRILYLPPPVNVCSCCFFFLCFPPLFICSCVFPPSSPPPYRIVFLPPPPVNFCCSYFLCFSPFCHVSIGIGQVNLFPPPVKFSFFCVCLPLFFLSFMCPPFFVPPL